MSLGRKTLLACVGLLAICHTNAAEEPAKSQQPEPPIKKQAQPLSFGGERHDFTVDGGHRAFVVLPKDSGTNSANRTWVWYAPTFIPNGPPSRENEWIFSRLLEAGFGVAGVDVGESYGSPDGRKVFTAFHSRVVQQFGLSPKVCLLPQSRGGLMLYNWAAEHPEQVRCVGGIYTVCDLRSYPGLDKAAPAYHLTTQALTTQLSENNPIDRLAPLVKAKVPIFHIHGDTDKLVPLEKNAGELVKRYKALGGQAQLVIVPGKGHEVCPEFFQSDALLQFFLNHK